MVPEGFNPKKIDCEQWIKTVKEAGCKYAIFTTKHHDGFTNWPSEYSSYSIKYTPYKDGKGDAVREFVDACRKYYIKVNKNISGQKIRIYFFILRSRKNKKSVITYPHLKYNIA